MVVVRESQRHYAEGELFDPVWFARCEDGPSIEAPPFVATITHYPFLRSGPARFFEFNVTTGSSATLIQTCTCGAPR